jgi:hypothetical protein
MDHTEAAPEQVVIRRPLWEQPVSAEQSPLSPEPASQPAEEEPPVDGQVQNSDEDLADDPDAEPIEYPDPPLTGDPEIDEAINALARVVGGSLEDRLTAFEAAHRTLQDRLADVEG